MVSRPISQHGLARMIQTPSGINNRNVLDKRYYISAIQNHMFSLSEEIAKLKKQLTENKFEATNYEECKKQVEELSQQMAGIIFCIKNKTGLLKNYSLKPRTNIIGYVDTHPVLTYVNFQKSFFNIPCCNYL